MGLQRVRHNLASEQQQSQAQWEIFLPSSCNIIENRSHKNGPLIQVVALFVVKIEHSWDVNRHELVLQS